MFRKTLFAALIAFTAAGPALAEGARLLALCTSQEVRARFMAGYERLFA